MRAREHHENDFVQVDLGELEEDGYNDKQGDEYYQEEGLRNENEQAYDD